jgi:DNA polymerase-1
VTPTDLPFDEIWLHDFEFVPKPGEHPDVVCLVARELRSGQMLRLWRDELTKQSPYRTDDRVLFVNFIANAELCCHLALGWPIPKNVLDLSAAFRNLVNGRSTPEGKGLIGALRYYGIDNIGAKQKDAMQKRVMRGWPYSKEEQRQILDYCEGDVNALGHLLPKILPNSNMTPGTDLRIALHHGEFLAAAATMEHHGVPIDMEIFSQLADPETWRAVRDEMVPTIDAKYQVYLRNNKSGDWTFKEDRFVDYLKRESIPAWPLLESGKLNLQEETFEDMADVWPQLEELRQLRHTRNKMKKIKLAVGRDGRNRTVLWAFAAKTSRTQPNASEWIYSPAVWLRALIKPAPGMAIAYVDYSSMEFLIAASLSDGHCGTVNNMLDMYESGDPYLAFAKSVGAVPRDATKASHGEEREKYKVMVLAVQYSMSSQKLASRLKISAFEADEMLKMHRSQFAQYWKWSDDWMQHAFQTGMMRNAMGWTCRVGTTEFNDRMVRNWPIQSTGADILRIACIMAVRHGIKLCAPIHDAVLIEAPIDRIDADVALMKEIMRRASRAVLNSSASGTHELRSDVKVVKYPDRYSDKRGAEIWKRVIEQLGTMSRRTKDREPA